MIELVSEKVWESLRTVTWPGPVRAAIAYVGREAPDLLPLGAGDTLVFDGSDESLAGGTTNPAALQVLFDRGVILVSVARLHAKVIVAGVEEAGERKTLVGSANASEHSRTSLREAALLTDDIEVAEQADLQIDEWSGDPEAEWVDQQWIDRAVKIYRPRRSAIPPRKVRRPGESNQRLWIAPWTVDEIPLSAAVESAVGHYSARFSELDVWTYRLVDEDHDVKPSDELLVFEVKDDQDEPHGNRRSWPLSRVVRVVDEADGPSRVAICVSPFEGARMTYAHLGRVLADEGGEISEIGLLSPGAERAVRRALAVLEMPAEKALEADRDALIVRPISCPRCQARLRVILRGMPPGPPDPDVYVLGGCVVGPGPLPTHACPACGWEGRRRTWEQEDVLLVASLDDLFRHFEADDLESLADRVTDDLDHDPIGLDVHEDSDGSAIGVEAILGGTGVLLEFPFSNVDFWDTWDGLHDSWELRTDEQERELDEA